MGWVKLDDRFPSNPKVVGLTLRAKWLYIEGLCYCAGALSNGRIPRTVARKLGSLKSAHELIAAGLWTDEPDGFYVHDYLAYNPTKAQAEARSLARSNAASIRWSNASRSGDVLGDGTGTGLEEQESFARFFAACPKHEGEGFARERFCAIVADGIEPEVLIAGAKRWAANVAGTELRFIAKPANWLASEGWKDDYRTAPESLSPAQKQERWEREMKEAGLL